MNMNAVIQQMVETIRDEYEPEKIILFGSYAWGEPDRESDVDILVIKDSDKREVQRVVEVRKLLRRFQRHPYLLSLDVLVKTPEEIAERLEIGDQFIQEIIERGRVVYERAMV